MLVLSRKIQEEILIGDDVRLVILDINRTQVRVGIVAPRSTPIFRSELVPDGEKPSTLPRGDK